MSLQKKTVLTTIAFVVLAMSGSYLYGRYLTAKFIRQSCRGRIIYVGDGSSLLAMDLKTGKSQSIMGLPSSGGNYDLSRDLNVLAYEEKSSSASDKSTDLLVVQDIKRDRRLLERVIGGECFSRVSLSPNGDKIAFGYTEEPVGNLTWQSRLAVMDLRSRARLLDEPCEDGVSWSPDGKKIAFVDKWGRSVMVTIASRERQMLVGQGSPQISPDGKWIILGEKFIYDCQRKKLEWLHLDYQVGERVLWSPDSRQFLYSASWSDLLPGKLYMYDLPTHRAYLLPIPESGLMRDAILWTK